MLNIFDFIVFIMFSAIVLFGLNVLMVLAFFINRKWKEGLIKKIKRSWLYFGCFFTSFAIVNSIVSLFFDWQRSECNWGYALGKATQYCLLGDGFDEPFLTGNELMFGQVMISFIVVFWVMIKLRKSSPF